MKWFNFKFLLSLLLVMMSFHLQAKETVTLQLKWHHQFQFAGYYAAVEKGFFAEEGLDVKLLERDQNRNNIIQVLSGEADYGIADAALLLYQTHQTGVRIVAPIFQHSPNVILTLASADIRSPQDLVGKRIRFYNNEAEGFPIMAMLDKYNVLEQGIVRQPYTTDFGVLARGETDAIYGYSTNEPYVLREQGVDVHVLNPVHFGIDLYGDMLFTTEHEVSQNPERVQAMRRAVIRGWEYALDNKEELVQLIYEKYSQRKSIAALRYEAQALEQVISRFTVPLGTLDRGRLEHMSRLFAKHGLLDRDFSVESYIFDRPFTGRLELTDDERAFIADNRQIRVGIDRDWFPFDFVNEDGMHDGIAAEYLEILSKRLGFKFEVETTRSWPDVLKMMQNRELDMLVMAANTPERSAYAHFTRPYLRSPMVIVTDSREDFLDGVRDLLGQKVVVVEGYASHEWLKGQHPELELELVTTTLEGLRKVAMGEAYAFVDNLASVSFLIKQQGLANLKISGQFPYSFDLAMGARSDWPLLRSILQKGLESITPQEHAEIYDNWVRLEYDYRIDYSKVAPAFAVGLILMVLVMLYTLRLRGLHQRLQDANVHLQIAEEKLIKQNQELERLSITDKLTGAFNRHKLDDSLQDLVEVAHRYDRPLSAVLFDLDYFKTVNDTYGHQVGDKVLQRFVAIVKKNIRTSDLFGRWGGEEFLLICPETGVNDASDLANKLRMLMASEKFEPDFKQTVSAGVSQLKLEQTADQLISSCDKLLYRAKKSGRDRIQATQPN